MSIVPSPRNGTSAETSKTLLILRFLATGAEETNESDFEETGFSIISSCRLEVSARGLRLFFPLIYIKKTPLVNKKIIFFRMVILEVTTIWNDPYMNLICPNTEYYPVYFY
jgi:hypothetical protein